MSSFPAVFSTRNVSTCPALRPLFSSVESSLRITLFSVTTGDFRMSQTVKLLIVSRLLLHGLGLCFFLWRCTFVSGLLRFRLCFFLRLRLVRGLRLFSFGLCFFLSLWLVRCLSLFSLRLRFLLCLRLFFRRFCLSVLGLLRLRVEKLIQLFDCRFRDKKLFVIKQVVDVQPETVRDFSFLNIARRQNQVRIVERVDDQRLSAFLVLHQSECADCFQKILRLRCLESELV